jgi:hypothetical protein
MPGVTRMTRALLAIAALVLVTLPARAEQTNMKSALDQLRAARQELEEAKADKGGHRQKALDHVTKAIDEVQKGIEFGRDKE